jgi:hypothetical protein
MAGTLRIKINGETVSAYSFDSLEGVNLHGQNQTSYYRAANPESDMSYIDILGENVQMSSEQPQDPEPDPEPQPRSSF